MSDSAPALQIDVVSDVVCPWCFVGKRQLEEAIDRYREAHPEAEFSIRWHPFQLNPDLPREGVNRSDYLRRKFGNDDTGALYERVRRAAGTVGLSLDMAAIVRQPNTLSAHALMEMAAAEACQDALAEALFAAYFQQGRDLTDERLLRDIAREAGLPEPAIEQALTDAALLDSVADADRRAREAGIGGVPCFIINRRIAVNGAQGAPALLEAFDEAGGAS
jgi:predicted DsbA family dithiol-disulfide isomerase